MANHLLFDFDYHCTAEKCSETSIEFRNAGNALYKEKFNTETILKILSLYSKSVAFAPNESEELALAYGNRSALLKRMKKFEESIVDIDRAVLIFKSDTIKAKLLSRKDECLRLINKSKIPSMQITSKLTKSNSEKLELPKITQSKQVSCLSESVSLKLNEKYGKHLIANKNIKPGDIVAIEEAYIAFPSIDKHYTVCSHCLSQTFNGLPCNFCAMVIYCSENCKKEAWKEYHDIECSIVGKTSLLKLPIFLRDIKKKFFLIARFIIKIIKTHSLEKILEKVQNSDPKMMRDTFSCNEFESLYSMASQSNNVGMEKTISLFEEFSSEIISLLSQSKNIFTEELKSNFKSEDELFSLTKKLFVKFFHIKSLNAFMFDESHCKCNIEGICGGQCVNRGSIIVPCCSLFNHSCFSNCTRVFAEKKKIVIVATKPIKKYQQLYITYSHFSLIDQPKAARQTFLKKNFNFTCDCQPCAENWPIMDVRNWKDPDSHTMKRIWDDYSKFCLRKGMRPILFEKQFDPSMQMPYDIPTLRQVIYFTELIFKNRCSYDLADYLFTFNTFI